MLKVKTGQSTKANAAEAGREAASYVKDEIKDMRMAFVYSGVQYDQKELIRSDFHGTSGRSSDRQHVIHRGNHTRRLHIR